MLSAGARPRAACRAFGYESNMRIALLAVVLGACESTKTEPTGFEGGDFEVTIGGVTDMCAGGSLDAVFQPDGGPADFEAPMELPGVSELPWRSTVDFVDPFGEMQVDFTEGEAGSDWIEAVGGEPPGAVEVDPANAAGCYLDSTVDLYAQIIGANELTGSAIVHLSSFAEESCPEITGDDCDVKLDLRWQRI